ncbi:MAG: protein-(glutamine-N5) methyltransferase, release factor-specific [Rhodobacteraceae bacterium]|nr:MAG: protein-(glutamine-N5) methyltransferase, release factor-specific [Paracoccaceae bacterium]
MSVAVNEALTTATKWLADAGIPNADVDARILLAHAMDCEPSRLMLIGDEEVHPEVFRTFDGYLAAREKFQPVSQIIGGREFWGRWFVITPDVLDPRPETESLIETALQHGPFQRILDLGTGSGILAVTLAAEWADARAIAIDISSEAIAIATKNAVAHDVSDRVNLIVSNWFDAVAGQFDLIVSNPPYIAAAEMAELSPDVRNWEPFLALTPGGDGLETYRIIAPMLNEFLADDGLALFEIGHTQGTDVVEIFKTAGFANVTVSQDLGGKDRVVAVKK